MESLITTTRSLPARAFTLVEMMVVMAIIGIVMAFSAVGLSHVITATDLTGTGDHILGQMTQARQTAIADNAHVELRLYQPVRTKNSEGHWALLLTREMPDGTSRNILPAYRLPGTISIVKGSKFSTLIGNLPEEEDKQPLIKNANTEANPTYTAFRFNPDGSTSLPSKADDDTWHLTLISRGSAISSGQAIPSNFYTIRVDPFTGIPKSFRP